MATTILDRIVHRCTMLKFEGKRYRLKEAAARNAIGTESSYATRSCPEQFARPDMEPFGVAIGETAGCYSQRVFTGVSGAR